MTSLLRPLFALFTRAVRDDLRAKFPIVLRAILLLVLLGLLAITQFTSFFLPAAGQFVLGYLATLNFAGVTILGLATFASAITEEKEDETLGLLRMTRLNPLAIVLGKSTARLSSGLLFLAVQVPFALLCATLGGVATTQILEVYAVLCAYLFFLCNLGLLFSVVCQTTARSVTFTIIVGVLLFLLAPMLWFAKLALGGGILGFSEALGYLVSVNPVLHLSYAVAGRALMPFQPDSIAFLLVAGAACFAFSWLAFERFCGGEIATAAPEKKAAAQSRGRISRPWRRPLVWKDFYFSTGGPRKIWVRLVGYAICVGLYLWPHYQSFEERPLWVFAEALAFCAGIGFTLEFAIAAAAIFGNERRQQTLGTLWVLPCTPQRLIRQKVGGYTLGLLPSGLLWLGSVALMDAALRESTMGQYDYQYRTSGFLITQVYAVAQFLFFGLLITYLSLIMRRGALVAGLLAYLVWNFFFVSLLSAIMFQALGSGLGSLADYEARQLLLIGGLIVALAILSGILIVLIPRRLATCAAEE